MNPMSTEMDLERRVNMLAEQARGLEVTDQQSYDLASDRLRGGGALRGEIVDHHRATDADGFLTVSERPGIGIDLDWERLGEHPARRGNRIRLFERGWELRRSVDDE